MYGQTQFASTRALIDQMTLALPAGNAFTRGKHQLVVLTFKLSDDLTELPSIQLTDRPVNREVVDLNANPRRAVFNDQ